MPPRNRDTGQGQYPEPDWDEYGSDEEFADTYDDPAGFAGNDLPDWSDQSQPSYPADQSPGTRGSQPQQASPAPRRRSTAPLPELSRSLQKPPTAAPHRSAPRPTQARQQPQYVEPAEDDWAYEENWELEEITYSDEYVDEYDYPLQPRRRGGGRTRARTRPAPRPPAMPPALAAAISAQDRGALYLFAASIVSIFLMSLMLAARIGDLPDVIPIHLDASGTPDLWGTASTLWRIVLAAIMITLINMIAAWFLSTRDVFIGRFLVGSSLLAQVLAWIALFLLLW